MAEVTYREALRRALDEELARDERVFLMGEEIGRFEGSYKVTAGLWEKYGPTRVRETPISEEGFVGAGIGAAMLGLRPVVEIMTTEVQTCEPGEHVNTLMHVMTEHRVRHVPVLVEGKLAGIISIGDVVKSRIGELEFERDQLTSYVAGAQ